MSAALDPGGPIQDFARRMEAELERLAEAFRDAQQTISILRAENTMLREQIRAFTNQRDE